MIGQFQIDFGQLDNFLLKVLNHCLTYLGQVWHFLCWLYSYIQTLDFWLEIQALVKPEYPPHPRDPQSLTVDL